MDAPSTNPKRKVKPRKLLDPKKTSSAAKALMSANARQSPLLRVSPEIRNSIYKLVLGGQALHVLRTSWQSVLGHTICTSHVDEETSKNSSGDLHGSWLDPAPHEYCCQSSNSREGEKSGKLDLSLLRVCKQIHEEAALLPFALNTFLLQNMSQLAWFSENLLSAQRSAVASIVVDSDEVLFDTMSWGRPSQAEKARLRRLTGLKKLRLNVEVYCARSPPTKDLNLLLARWLEFLPLCSLEDATVRLKPFDGFLESNELSTNPIPTALADWCLEAEKALLQKPGN